MNWIAYHSGDEYATGTEAWSGWYIRQEEDEDSRKGPFFNEQEARQAAVQRNAEPST